MDNKFYKLVNRVLAEEFGEGNVKLKPAEPGNDWEYTLWFLEDNPPLETIRRAEEIVNEYQPTDWMEDRMFHSD